MTNPSDITTEQMLEYLSSMDGLFYMDEGKAILKAIRARMTEYEGLENANKTYEEIIGNQADEIVALKAEVVDLKDRVSTLVEIRDEFEEMCEKAEAALEQARPLLGAVEAFKESDSRGLVIHNCSTDGMYKAGELLRAAIAYRAKKEGK